MGFSNSHSLLRRAHAELDAAHSQASPREQFIHAHMAALRGAAAALAAGAERPGPKRRKVRSAWVQLAELGEQWQPWVEYYSASAQTRAALESGQLRDVDAAAADTAVSVAAQFLGAVERCIREHEAQFRSLAQAS